MTCAVGFVVDIVEAQFINSIANGSGAERMFLICDVVFTCFFSIDVLTNAFAHSEVCLICMPYMYALYVCLICMPYI